ALRTGVTNEATRGLSERLPRLATSLRTLGYHGLGLPGDALLHARTGLASGFDRYSPRSPALSDSARADSALAWLQLPGKRFVWVDFSATDRADVWRRGDHARASRSTEEASREVARAVRRLSDGAGSRNASTLLALLWVDESAPHGGTNATLVLAG